MQKRARKTIQKIKDHAYDLAKMSFADALKELALEQEKELAIKENIRNLYVVFKSALQERQLEKVKDILSFIGIEQRLLYEQSQRVKQKEMVAQRAKDQLIEAKKSKDLFDKFDKVNAAKEAAEFEAKIRKEIDSIISMRHATRTI